MIPEDPDIHYFHYYCDQLGMDVMIEDWLIPHYELEGARGLAGTRMTCAHCGGQHLLFIRRPSEQHKARLTHS